jgi:hypothetical protein
MCAIARAHRGVGESQSLLEQELLAMHASGQRSASTPRVAAIRLRSYCQKIGADVWASGCTDRAGQNDGDAPALGKRRLEYPSRQYDRIYSAAVGKFVAGATATRAATRARARTPTLPELTLATAASHREASVCPRRQPMNTAIIVAAISATWMDPAMPARPSSEPDMVNDFDALHPRQRIGVPCCGQRRTPRADKRRCPSPRRTSFLGRRPRWH